jgi:hypothetical protein
MSIGIQVESVSELVLPHTCPNCGQDTEAQVELRAHAVKSPLKPSSNKMSVPMCEICQTKRNWFRLINSALTTLVLVLVIVFLRPAANMLISLGLPASVSAQAALSLAFLLVLVTYTQIGRTLIAVIAPSVYDAYHAVYLLQDYDTRAWLSAMSTVDLPWVWLVARDEAWAQRIQGGGQRMGMAVWEPSLRGRLRHRLRLPYWMVGALVGLASSMLTALGFFLLPSCQLLIDSVGSGILLGCQGTIGLIGLILGTIFGNGLSRRWGRLGAIVGGVLGGIMIPGIVGLMLLFTILQGPPLPPQ